MTTIREALELAVHAMRAPLDDWKGELERKALDAARAALAAQPAQAQPLTVKQLADIIREVGQGSAIRRDGSTSYRIARAVERAHGIGEKP